MGGSSSDLQPVLSGFLQGSVLRPIFFIFYINDMSVQLMAGTMSFYADDMFCCIILFAIDYRTSISIAYVIALPAVVLLLMPPNANT